MGYTHYFPQNGRVSDLEWQRLCNAFRLAMEEAQWRHVIQREEDDASPPKVSDEMIAFNGIGEDAHETMVLQKRGTGFQFCKTARKPYDFPVQVLLILAHHYAPSAWNIGSDGTPAEWEPALMWVNSLGLGEFSLPPGIR